ncbi:MAG: ATP-dependent helicase [Planctomycetota bacterium]|nr:ATP-dependent helicase [Planctomycetota bacterium]MDA1162491.1 ATP-dependent helicase [Planctomycetota bacterium]
MQDQTTSPLSTDAAQSLLQDLNDQQKAAASHGNGPLLIVAGAGTGKTTTLTHRVAWLIHSGVDPRRILLLTFTRRSAVEMLSRVSGCLQRMQRQAAASGSSGGGALSNAIWGGTFHAMASRLLRQHGRLIGLEPDFTVLDRSDSEDLLDIVRAELKLSTERRRFPLKQTCLSIYSRCINSRAKLQTVLEEVFPWCVDFEDELKQLFKGYVERKDRLNCLDYDDLLLFWNALVSDESGARAIRRQFDCVLVDEYQDTNLLQSEILQQLCPDGNGLTVVGDDAQSIYSFRAATVRNILDFPKQFPGTTTVLLEENYRSTQPVLDAANMVIAEATERHHKELWTARTNGIRPQVVSCRDEEEQSDFVIREILHHRDKGIDLKHQAVLFRASHHSLNLELLLAEQNIPFHKYGGLKFAEAAHIKDFLAFLRLADNPFDMVSALRILMLLPGIGRKRAMDLTDGLYESDGNFETWASWPTPSATKDIWPQFVGLLNQLAELKSGRNGESSVPIELDAVRKFFAPIVEEKYPNARERLLDLEQVVHISARYPNRTEFLTAITLDPPASTQDLAADPVLDEDYLVLSTIHSSKGLEWDSVFVLHAADGNIPSDMSTKDEQQIEEERRLFYVALSRAKDHLYVCHPQRYYRSERKSFRDDYSFSQLTRFLTPKARACFDWRLPDSDDVVSTLPPETLAPSEIKPLFNARDQAKSMWD